MKKFTYFVSYVHRMGVGWSVIERDIPLTTVEEIRSITNFIENTNGLNDVSIINFQLLSESEETEE